MTSDLMQRGTRCTARRKNGEPCNNWAMRGSNVCRLHGGAAPQVRRAAQVRLLKAADTLMAELLKIAVDTSLPANVRLTAIRDALDRAGITGKQEIEVSLGISKWDRNLAGIITYDDIEGTGDAYSDLIVEEVLIGDEDGAEPEAETTDWYATDEPSPLPALPAAQPRVALPPAPAFHSSDPPEASVPRSIPYSADAARRAQDATRRKRWRRV